MIFKLFDVEKYLDLEIWVKGHSPFEFMHDLYIYRPGALFLALMVWSSFVSTRPLFDNGASCKYGISYGSS